MLQFLSSSLWVDVQKRCKWEHSLRYFLGQKFFYQNWSRKITQFQVRMPHQSSLRVEEARKYNADAVSDIDMRHYMDNCHYQIRCVKCNNSDYDPGRKCSKKPEEEPYCVNQKDHPINHTKCATRVGFVMWVASEPNLTRTIIYLKGHLFQRNQYLTSLGSPLQFRILAFVKEG